MSIKRDKYVNFRQSEEVWERIGVIQRLLSERLDMNVSRAYVVRMIMDEGLRNLEEVGLNAAR